MERGKRGILRQKILKQAFVCHVLNQLVRVMFCAIFDTILTVETGYEMLILRVRPKALNLNLKAPISSSENEDNSWIKLFFDQDISFLCSTLLKYLRT